MNSSDTELIFSSSTNGRYHAIWASALIFATLAASPVLTSCVSHLRQDALAEQLEAGPAIRRPLDHLEAIHMPLGDAVRPTILQRAFYSCPITHDSFGELHVSGEPPLASVRLVSSGASRGGLLLSCRGRHAAVGKELLLGLVYRYKIVDDSRPSTSLATPTSMLHTVISAW
jgi:hypothetical protein